MRRGPAGAPERRRADREPRPEEHPDSTQSGAEAPAPGRRPPAQDGGGPAARSRGPEKPKSAQQKLFCLKLVLNKTPFLCGFGRGAAVTSDKQNVAEWRSFFPTAATFFD